jgi:hypothetical protein
MDRRLFGIVVVRDHPVILSDLSRSVPVMDPGFWVVEPQAQRLRRPEAASVTAGAAR